MMNQPNFYETLEIPSDADAREIKRAYHRLARDLHPDKASSPDEARRFEERFALVSAAYNTLKDEAKRAEYDKQLKTDTGVRRTASAAVSRTAPPPSPATSSSVSASKAATGPSRVALGLTPEKIAIAQKAFAKGMQYFKEGNFAKAVDFFEAAIQNNDTEAAYHARLAASLIKARKSASRAISVAQRAIELDPYNMEHRLVLAEIFVTIGSTTNAQKVYEEILKWDAGNVRAIEGLGGLKHRSGGLGPLLNSPHLKTFKSILDRFRK